ncbi:hypothetical protein [Methylomusa anaerophila]|uniref:hypothetical protein n=1 Tax=Methylomusa anaerophila TaxID=1930071 RepID=UPI0013155714|nr:hypothetical protein [Methylomusa anaerophila]
MHEVTINGVTYLAAGISVILINGQKSLVDDTGKAIAWFSEAGTWIANEASSA